jgi:hypothetical protein
LISPRHHYVPGLSPCMATSPSTSAKDSGVYEFAPIEQVLWDVAEVTQRLQQQRHPGASPSNDNNLAMVLAPFLGGAALIVSKLTEARVLKNPLKKRANPTDGVQRRSQADVGGT